MSWLGVDANQGYGIDALDKLVPALVDAQRLAARAADPPRPRGRSRRLRQSPIPIAADESVLSLADMPGLVGRFHVVNIKLDKCGGLTEALAMAREARQLGLGVMVGNMVGTSLAMAPAFVARPALATSSISTVRSSSQQDREPERRRTRTAQIWCGDEVWGTRQLRRRVAA